MLTKKSVLLAKVETTYNQDAGPTAADDAISIEDFTPKVDGKVLDRNNYRQSLSPLQHVIGRIVAEFSFTTELKGAGAVYSASVKPETAALFRGAGMSETIDTTPGSEKIEYAPVSDGFESLTMYVYIDGILLKATGCRGTFDIDLEAGEYGKVKWNFKGVFVSVTDVGFPAATFDATLPPIVQSTGLTLGSYASATVTKVGFMMNCSLSEKMSVNAGAGGLAGIELTGRGTKGGIDPDATLEAEKSWWANWKDAAAEALTMTVGDVQYNKIKFDAPKAQYSEIGIGDRDGTRKYDIPLRLAQNTGDDELVITML